MPLLEILRALNAAFEYWNGKPLDGMGLATATVEVGEEDAD